MLKLRETIAYLVAVLSMTAALVCVVTLKEPNSEVTASWVQAFGSIAAIVVVTLPVLLQQSLARSEARLATLSTVQGAYGMMQEVAHRYVDPDHSSSEWSVPHWAIMENALSQCPIYHCGSSEAVSAFLAFREHFMRADAINQADDWGSSTGSLNGFIGFIMLNASAEVSKLEKALK